MTDTSATASRRRTSLHPALRRAVLLILALQLVAACSGNGPSGDEARTSATPTAGSRSSAPVTVEAPPDVTVVAELGYPRDLYERGRVNLVTSRDDDAPFVVLSKQLRAAFFTPAGVEDRFSVIPPAGQPVALQAAFGSVSDCTTDAPVTASVDLTYRYGRDPTVRRSSFPLTDARVLDQIRARVCTARHVSQVTEIDVSEPVIDGESMTLDVTLKRRQDSGPLAVESVGGTVLFGADSARVTPPMTLAPGDPELTIPLIVRVNRCDAHAVAETTRRAGVDLWVSIEGQRAHPVPLPIDSIVDDMDAILDTCRERTGGR